MKLEDLLVKKSEPVIFAEPGIVEIPQYLINDPEPVGYPDTKMQDDIYRWAIEDINFFGTDILDVGAGRGDLFSVMPYVNSFHAFETTVGLCEAGKVKYGNNPTYNIYNEDYLTSNNEGMFDYGFCIGTLNSIQTTDKWNTCVKVFNQMWVDCKVGLIFIVNTGSDEAGNNGFPFTELFTNLIVGEDKPFKLDYSKYEGIYKLRFLK